MSNMKAKIFAAFEKIGKSNGTAAPASQDTAVSVLHEYHVATLGESFFKKRREIAKKAVDKLFDDSHRKKIDSIIVSTKKNETGESAELIQTEPYILAFETKNGASYLDVAALKVTLARKCKLTMTEVEALIEECSDRREPSQSLKVVER